MTRFLTACLAVAPLCAAVLIVACDNSGPAPAPTQYPIAATLTSLPAYVPSIVINGTTVPSYIPNDPLPPEEFGPFLIGGYKWTPEPEAPTPDHELEIKRYFDACEVQEMDLFEGLDKLALPAGFKLMGAEGVVIDGEDSGLELWFEGQKRTDDPSVVPPTIEIVRRRLLPDEKVEVWPEVPGRLVDRRQNGDAFVVILWHYPGDLTEINIVDGNRAYTSIVLGRKDVGQVEKIVQSILEPSSSRMLPDYCVERLSPRPTPPGGRASDD